MRGVDQGQGEVVFQVLKATSGKIHIVSLYILYSIERERGGLQGWIPNSNTKIWSQNRHQRTRLYLTKYLEKTSLDCWRSCTAPAWWLVEDTQVRSDFPQGKAETALCPRGLISTNAEASFPNDFHREMGLEVLVHEICMSTWFPYPKWALTHLRSPSCSWKLQRNWYEGFCSPHNVGNLLEERKEILECYRKEMEYQKSA